MFYKMKRFFLFSLLLLISEALMSASIDPPPPGGAPQGFPIQGILYAVALALGYGIYAVKEKNKK